jgi:hypothetical protein
MNPPHRTSREEEEHPDRRLDRSRGEHQSGRDGAQLNHPRASHEVEEEDQDPASDGSPGEHQSGRDQPQRNHPRAYQQEQHQQHRERVPRSRRSVHRGGKTEDRPGPQQHRQQHHPMGTQRTNQSAGDEGRATQHWARELVQARWSALDRCIGAAARSNCEPLARRHPSRLLSTSSAEVLSDARNRVRGQ